jgi:DMSO reductase iron-sulfur subunit
MTYAFTFDASACTGCKACQIACKDKNNLPVGVLWRRVYEVTGGAWTGVGARSSRPGAGEPSPYSAWTTNVFAYHLSIACNHCVHPKCAGVCPVDAYVVREDGIVYIDESKCMGCGYCSWACPYAAPQYDPDQRHMTKCNFCFDNLDAGLPPACVAACPMRVLNFASVDDGLQTVDGGQGTVNAQPSQTHDLNSSIHGQPSTVHGPGSTVPGPVFHPLWSTPSPSHPFPLPDNSRTQPHLALKPHAGMVNGLEKTLSNQEEVKPANRGSMKFQWPGDLVGKGFDELPLLIFTLCAQMAAGMAVFSLFVQPSTLNLLAIGILLGMGGLVSFLHLGTKRNAWRSIFHLRKSWLSREVLMAGLFGLSWLFSLIEHWSLNTEHWLPVTAWLGLGLIYSMARVYRLRSVPAWNSWRINTAFFMTTGILGAACVSLLGGIKGIWVLLLLFLAGQLALVLSVRELASRWAVRVRAGLLLVGLTVTWMALRMQAGMETWMIVLLFLILLAEEVIGRWKFYQALHDRLM